MRTERRRHNRDVGEVTLHVPPVRKRAYFFRGLDGHWNMMVKAPDYIGNHFPRATLSGIVTR